MVNRHVLDLNIRLMLPNRHCVMPDRPTHTSVTLVPKENIPVFIRIASGFRC